MKSKAEIIAHIGGMRKRWGMYAITREGFVNELSAYLFVFLDDTTILQEEFYSKLRDEPTASAGHLLRPIDEDFAHRACDLALAMLAKG